ncbi:hypothetical protein Mal15_10380 [Stieleria maiorica]|uniref:PEP-CTERM protein-sorting domain-containing protein n=1 Tax=Stieleria maiorica TaxID=2795974 RepID=A0A5B9M735_9BACT|nr:PEP-CTERM sorting domain-containing protein [Stieleria maiorica]QEF97008.1 hypothetical protein Mal15_10380 [Stieleria maiorica]
MTRLVLLSVLVACFSGSLVAEVVINESDYGDDFSNLPNAPTDFGTLELGETTVNGLTSYINFFEDPDIFTFTVAPGQRLDSVSFLSFDDDGHFFGLDAGSTSDSGNGTQLLIATLVGGPDLNVNLLNLTPSEQDFGGTHTPGPLAAGDYTIWIQENTIEGVFGYSLALQTSAVAIPEPSSAFALCVLGGALLIRRRREI